MNISKFTSSGISCICAIAALTFAASVLGSPGGIWVPLTPGAGESVPVARILEDSDAKLTVQWELSGYYIADVNTSHGVFQQLHFNRGEHAANGEPGTPQLPYLAEAVRLPHGKMGTAAVIDVEWVDIEGEIRLYPQQPPRRDDGSPAKPLIYDDAAYKSLAELPAIQADITTPQGWGGVPAAGLHVIPARYTPDERRLSVARRITVSVEYIPAVGLDFVQPGKPSLQIWAAQQAILLNPPDFPRIQDADENEPVRMLVIIKEEALRTAQPILDYHHNSGVRTEIWIADDIENPAEIKDRVREMFEDGGLEFIFIIGDGYEEDPDVPMFLWDPVDPGWQDDESTASHSDQWLVCLDPPARFRDGQLYDDHLPELAVGRLVYDSEEDLDQLEIQVDKLTDYLYWRNLDNADGAAWLGRELLVADDDLQDGQRVYINCKQRIMNWGYDLPHPDFTLLSGLENGVNNNTVINFINDEGVGFFNYRGHGDSVRWWRWNRRNQSWNRNQVEDLENRDRPFIAILSACQNANIADYNGDCLGESFQKQSGGSVSLHGSIISSYTWGNSFFDEALHRVWFDSDDEPIYTIGHGAVAASAALVMYFDSDTLNGRYPVVGRMNARTYHWLGDPALEYRTGTPVQLLVDLPQIVPRGTRRIAAHVTADGDPVANTRVCLRTPDDGIYLVTRSDDEGAIEFEFDPPLNEIGMLNWMAAEHNGIPAVGGILVSNGFGSIEGHVAELADGMPLEGAELELAPVDAAFNATTFTDADGYYMFDGMFEFNYTLTARMPGHISESREVMLLANEHLIIDFALSFSRLEVDSAMISQHLELNESARRSLTIRNPGNGALEWQASLQPIGDLEDFELTAVIPAGIELEDDRLHGVVFTGERYYIAGGNDNADPNYIYVLDREGRYLEDESFSQPNECIGLGLRDLAWDGEYLYGGSNDETIFVLNLDGDVVSRIAGPYNPNVALTFDGDGNLWCAGGRQDLVGIDIDGNITGSIRNNQDVKAMAWFPGEPAGYTLLLYVAGGQDEPVKLYQSNPQTGDTRLMTVLSEFDDEQPSNGLFLTNRMDPTRWTLMGTLRRNGVASVKEWHLGYRTSWSTLLGESGTVQPGEEDGIGIGFDSEGYEDGMMLNSTLVIENNGQEPQIEIDVTLAVGEIQSVGRETSNLPTEMLLGAVYPNPFNAVSQVVVDIPQAGRVMAALYSLDGRIAALITEGSLTAGRHTIAIDAGGLPSGIYILRLETGYAAQARKIALLR